MRVSDLAGREIVVWGTGIEGRALTAMIGAVAKVTVVDELPTPGALHGDAMAQALERADVVVKSAGVSLNHPLIAAAIARGTSVTTLLNLWMAETRRAKTILVTGSKGKSTTASLIGVALKAAGAKAVVAGNIGVAVTEVPDDADFAVIETSSYQAASLDADCDVGVVVSLFPDHLDWHGSVARYYHDKLNVLRHARAKVVSVQALRVMGAAAGEMIVANAPDGFHARDGVVWNGTACIGVPGNAYLIRPHNLANVCVALAVMAQLGFDPGAALAAMGAFTGLMHRQYELGTRNGVLYVDDSISTTPQSTIAALDVYRGPVSLIVGGHDRGVDYAPLAEALAARPDVTAICLGPSGKRLFEALNGERAVAAETMAEAVAAARRAAPDGGTVLLSPAASSKGMFRDFRHRGEVFAAEAGFTPAAAS